MGLVPVTSLGQVTAKIPLQDKQGTVFSNKAKLLILKSLSSGLLLGTDACLVNVYQISFPMSTIMLNGHEFTATAICLTLKRLPTSLKKCAIYSAISCTIQPVQGYNLPISHQYQHSHQDSLLVTRPVPQVQSEHASWGSLPAALVNGATD